MAINTEYAAPEPARSAIDALQGPAVLEFGQPSCGYCRAAQPLLASALESHPRVKHIKVEDGSGRRLGRSFGVRLWPTFVFLADGSEQARLVRPLKSAAFRDALAKVDPPA
jgi:thioredoxin 1